MSNENNNINSDSTDQITSTDTSTDDNQNTLTDEQDVVISMIKSQIRTNKSKQLQPTLTEKRIIDGKEVMIRTYPEKRNRPTNYSVKLKQRKPYRDSNGKKNGSTPSGI